MKYLFPILLVLFYSCKKDCTIQLVGLEVEAQSNLTESFIQSNDSLELSMSFSEELINSYNSESYNINPLDPRFLLYIRKYDASITETFPFSSFNNFPNAIDDFDVIVEKGEELEDFSIPSLYQDNKLFIRPNLTHKQYTLRVKLTPKNTSPGAYMAYWNVFNPDRGDLIIQHKKEKDSCRDFITLRINNKGISNLQFIASDSILSDKETWVSDHALVLFDVL